MDTNCLTCRRCSSCGSNSNPMVTISQPLLKRNLTLDNVPLQPEHKTILPRSILHPDNTQALMMQGFYAAKQRPPSRVSTLDIPTDEFIANDRRRMFKYRQKTQSFTDDEDVAINFFDRSLSKTADDFGIGLSEDLGQWSADSNSIVTSSSMDEFLDDQGILTDTEDKDVGEQTLTNDRLQELFTSDFSNRNTDCLNSTNDREHKNKIYTILYDQNSANKTFKDMKTHHSVDEIKNVKGRGSLFNHNSLNIESASSNIGNNTDDKTPTNISVDGLTRRFSIVQTYDYELDKYEKTPTNRAEAYFAVNGQGQFSEDLPEPKDVQSVELPNIDTAETSDIITEEDVEREDEIERQFDNGHVEEGEGSTHVLLHQSLSEPNVETNFQVNAYGLKVKPLMLRHKSLLRHCYSLDIRSDEHARKSVLRHNASVDFPENSPQSVDSQDDLYDSSLNFLDYHRRFSAKSKKSHGTSVTSHKSTSSSSDTSSVWDIEPEGFKTTARRETIKSAIDYQLLLKKIDLIYPTDDENDIDVRKNRFCVRKRAREDHDAEVIRVKNDREKLVEDEGEGIPDGHDPMEKIPGDIIPAEIEDTSPNNDQSESSNILIPGNVVRDKISQVVQDDSSVGGTNVHCISDPILDDHNNNQIPDQHDIIISPPCIDSNYETTNIAIVESIQTFEAPTRAKRTPHKPLVRSYSISDETSTRLHHGSSLRHSFSDDTSHLNQRRLSQRSTLSMSQLSEKRQRFSSNSTTHTITSEDDGDFFYAEAQGWNSFEPDDLDDGKSRSNSVIYTGLRQHEAGCFEKCQITPTREIIEAFSGDKSLSGLGSNDLDAVNEDNVINTHDTAFNDDVASSFEEDVAICNVNSSLISDDETATLAREMLEDLGYIQFSNDTKSETADSSLTGNCCDFTDIECEMFERSTGNECLSQTCEGDDNEMGAAIDCRHLGLNVMQDQPLVLQSALCFNDYVAIVPSSQIDRLSFDMKTFEIEKLCVFENEKYWWSPVVTVADKCVGTDDDVTEGTESMSRSGSGGDYDSDGDFNESDTGRRDLGREGDLSGDGDDRVKDGDRNIDGYICSDKSAPENNYVRNYINEKNASIFTNDKRHISDEIYVKFEENAFRKEAILSSEESVKNIALVGDSFNSQTCATNGEAGSNEKTLNFESGYSFYLPISGFDYGRRKLYRWSSDPSRCLFHETVSVYCDKERRESDVSNFDIEKENLDDLDMDCTLVNSDDDPDDNVWFLEEGERDNESCVIEEENIVICDRNDFKGKMENFESGYSFYLPISEFDYGRRKLYRWSSDPSRCLFHETVSVYCDKERRESDVSDFDIEKENLDDLDMDCTLVNSDDDPDDSFWFLEEGERDNESCVIEEENIVICDRNDFKGKMENFESGYSFYLPISEFDYGRRKLYQWSSDPSRCLFHETVSVYCDKERRESDVSDFDIEKENLDDLDMDCTLVNSDDDPDDSLWFLKEGERDNESCVIEEENIVICDRNDFKGNMENSHNGLSQTAGEILEYSGNHDNEDSVCNDLSCSGSRRRDQIQDSQTKMLGTGNDCCLREYSPLQSSNSCVATRELQPDVTEMSLVVKKPKATNRKSRMLIGGLSTLYRKSLCEEGHIMNKAVSKYRSDVLQLQREFTDHYARVSHLLSKDEWEEMRQLEGMRDEIIREVQTMAELLGDRINIIRRQGSGYSSLTRINVIQQMIELLREQLHQRSGLLRLNDSVDQLENDAPSHNRNLLRMSRYKHDNMERTFAELRSGLMGEVRTALKQQTRGLENQLRVRDRQVDFLYQELRRKSENNRKLSHRQNKINVGCRCRRNDKDNETDTSGFVSNSPQVTQKIDRCQACRCRSDRFISETETRGNSEFDDSQDEYVEIHLKEQELKKSNPQSCLKYDLRTVHVNR